MFEKPEENGRLIIIKFFTDYPESKKFFKTIPTEGDLYRNPHVARHGGRIMVAFNNMIENIENWQQVCKHLACLADTHKNTHRVPSMMFQRLFRSMLCICHDLMGDDLTNDMLVTWEKFFRIIYEEITVAYGRKRLL